MKNFFRNTMMAVTISCLIFTISGCGTAVESTEKNVSAQIKTIPFPEAYETKEAGASCYDGIGNHQDSSYYTHPDFYNMESTDTLTMISNFETYQQTLDYSCGAACIVMILNHFGETTYDEMTIVEMTETVPIVGVDPLKLGDFFTEIGWDVTNNVSKGNQRGEAPLTFEAFIPWMDENLSQGIPILVAWVDWDGHCQIIIGHDTMGTENTNDDVLVMADPFDTTDHKQDGYMIIPMERFFTMWHEGPQAEGDVKMAQPFVVAQPKAAKE